MLRMDTAAQLRRGRVKVERARERGRTGMGVGKKVPASREQGSLLCTPCAPGPSVEESSSCPLSLSAAAGQEPASHGAAVLEESPTSAGFERGLDYFGASQKMGGYVRSDLSKCNQISALS